MMREQLKHHFTNSLGLPQVAIEWLLDLWDAIQFLDDVMDGEAYTRDQQLNAMWALLIRMPICPFYQNNQILLSSALADALLKWSTADRAERDGRADAKSYVWRASYYDVVLTVVRICHSPSKAMQLAPTVMSIYGESFEDYMKEFNHA